MELKIRTKEQQMIDAFKKYIKTKGNVTLDYSLEAYMQVALDHISSLEKENRELKKQLDELQTLYNNMFKCHCNRVQVETLLEQQKEFIEYLESKIDTIIQQKETFAELEAGQAVSLMILAIALEKYKKIIGGKDE